MPSNFENHADILFNACFLKLTYFSFVFYFIMLRLHLLVKVYWILDKSKTIDRYSTINAELYCEVNVRKIVHTDGSLRTHEVIAKLEKLKELISLEISSKFNQNQK